MAALPVVFVDIKESDSRVVALVSLIVDCVEVVSFTAKKHAHVYLRKNTNCSYSVLKRCFMNKIVR